MTGLSIDEAHECACCETIVAVWNVGPCSRCRRMVCESCQPFPREGEEPKGCADCRAEDLEVMPCPFCGIEAIRTDVEGMIDVVCPGCGVEMRETGEHPDSSVERWNSRE